MKRVVIFTLITFCMSACMKQNRMRYVCSPVSIESGRAVKGAEPLVVLSKNFSCMPGERHWVTISEAGYHIAVKPAIRNEDGSYRAKDPEMLKRFYLAILVEIDSAQRVRRDWRNQ